MVKSAWNKGRRMPEATKRRIAEARKGIAAWNKGQPWSDKTKEKISASKKGRSPWNKGMSWPKETKKKISRSKLVDSISSKPYYKRESITPRLRYLVFKRDNYRCKICGRSQEDGVILEVDHLDPNSKGGPYTLENLKTLCRDCNRGRSNLDIK